MHEDAAEGSLNMLIQQRWDVPHLEYGVGSTEHAAVHKAQVCGGTAGSQPSRAQAGEASHADQKPRVCISGPLGSDDVTEKGQTIRLASKAAERRHHHRMVQG